MSDWVPKFKLYDSEKNLIYTFPSINETNAPQSPRDTVEIEGQRGKGSIIIDCGESAWNLILNGILIGEDYEDIASKINELENTVTPYTRFYLRIDKSPTTYYEYKVRRITPINYPESLRNNKQEYQITFRVNSW